MLLDGPTDFNTPSRERERTVARRLRRRTPSRRDIWHLDEVVVTISGRKHWLWRAVDQDGYVLDEIVQMRRGTKAAKRLLTRLLKKQGCPPRRMSTDKLGSYTAAPASDLTEDRASLAHGSEQSSRKFTSAAAPTRVVDPGFRSPGRLQRFTSVFSAVRNLFVPPRSRRSALTTRMHRLAAMTEWKSAACVPV
jgi:putative transposase